MLKGEIISNSNSQCSLISTLRGHSSWVKSVVFTPDGKKAISASSDKSLRLWDLSSGKTIFRFGRRFFCENNDRINSVAISPDGKMALSGAANGVLLLWDTESGSLIKRINRGFWSPAHLQSINSVAISSDGRTALSGSSDTTIAHWDIQTGDLINILEGHPDNVYSVVFGSDGKTALSGSMAIAGCGSRSSASYRSRGITWEQFPIIFWDLQTGKQKRSFERSLIPSRDVFSVGFLPDQKTIFSQNDSEFSLWDLNTGFNIITSRWFKFSLRLNVATISPDGKTVLLGDNKNKIIYASIFQGQQNGRKWYEVDGKPIEILTGHFGEISSLAFSPDSKTALSGSHDGTIKYWKLSEPGSPE